MPEHPDFRKIHRSMQKQYGKDKGNAVYYKWLNSHGYDDTKPLSNQKSKQTATAEESLLSLFDDMDIVEDSTDQPDATRPDSGESVGDGEEPDDREIPINDPMSKRTDSDQYGEIPAANSSAQAKELKTKQRNDLEDEKFAYPEGRKLPINDAAHVRNALARFNQTDLPSDKKGAVLGRICGAAKKFGIESDLCKEKGKAEASSKRNFIHVPAFKVPYVAAPKFEGKDGPIIVKAIVLEEGHNINGWRVVSSQFSKVADQYKAGRQLRLNHDKTVQSVIGKSFNGLVMKGADVQQYMGAKIEGVRPDGLYVAAEFEANPQDSQVRTNILQGYVETGSIGLDANAFCEECSRPVMILEDSSIERECRHYEAPIKLDDVDVKEYSYVAEPAFPHSIITPTFSAAVSNLLHRESSLSKSENTPPQQMSSNIKSDAVAIPDPKILAEAKSAVQAESRKSAEGDAEGEADAEALAAKYISFYEKGLKAAGRFRADDEPGEKKEEADATAEGEGKMEATASRKTDQVGKVAQPPSKTPAQTSKDEIWARAFTPTAFAVKTDGAIRDLFRAAAEHPKAPAEVKRKYAEVFG